MASAADIRAGRAFVELYVKGELLNLGLARASSRLAKFASDVAHFLSPVRILKSLGNSIASLGARMATAGVAMGSAFIYPIKAASDAVETINKFEAVFDRQAAAAGRFADELGKAVGRSRYEIRDSMAAFQAFFVGMGFDPAQARGMSEQLQALAVDFGSFFNVSDEEAGTRFIAALSGSGEVLDRFGINVKQAALQQELLRMGMKKTWTEVTEAEKAQARFNIILRTMTEQGAVGDAVKTAGSLANRWKALKGEMRDAAVVVGQALIPVVTPLIQKVVEIAKAIGAWAARNQEFIANLGGLIVKVTLAGVAIYAFGKYVLMLGVLTSAIFTLTKLYFIFTVLVPVLYKVAAALRITTIGFAGLKMVLTTFGPTILMAGAAMVTITALIGALAVAFANAKLQGISFGESVLDLTNKLTGAQNAYTGLRDTLEQQKGRAAIVGRLESATKADNPDAMRAGLDELRAERERVARDLAEAATPTKRRGWTGNPIIEPKDPERASMLKAELAQIDLLLSRFEGKLSGAEWKSALAEWAGMYTGLAREALDAGRKFGESFVAGLKETIKGVEKVMYDQMMGLRRARAEGIENSLQREIALIRLAYEERMKDAKAKGEPIGLIQAERDQQIENARKQEAARKADRLESLDDQVARAEIERDTKGPEREKALLELERKQALRDAETDPERERINRLYNIRQSMVGNEREESVRTAGTFSGYAAARMGGGGPQERIAKATERSAKRLDKIVEQNERIIEAERGVAFA